MKIPLNPTYKITEGLLLIRHFINHGGHKGHGEINIIISLCTLCSWWFKISKDKKLPDEN
jgi:hypothetical protein